jgi:hypothetical protein
MTVCIAAVAAKANAIVVVADRAAAYMENGETTCKTTSAFIKIREMRQGWAALIAGRMDFGERVVFAAERLYDSSHASDSPNVIAMPECVKIAFQAERKSCVIDTVLKPKMLTEEWYEQKLKSTNSENDDFFISIVHEVNSIDINTSIMLCGFERDTVAPEVLTPEIYIIVNPGILNSTSPERIAVAATGIGQETALEILFALGTTPSDDIEKVLYDAYAAKEAAADFKPDVGHEWDAMILVAGKPAWKISEDILALIKDLYDSHPRSPFDTPKKPPENWRDRLSEFSKLVLGRHETMGAIRHLNRGRER